VTKIPVYTIGYGNRSFKEFVELFRQYDIKFLVDVRSHPHSRFKPKFSEQPLILLRSARRNKKAGYGHLTKSYHPYTATEAGRTNCMW